SQTAASRARMNLRFGLAFLVSFRPLRVSRNQEFSTGRNACLTQSLVGQRGDSAANVQRLSGDARCRVGGQEQRGRGHVFRTHQSEEHTSELSHGSISYAVF